MSGVIDNLLQVGKAHLGFFSINIMSIRVEIIFIELDNLSIKLKLEL